MLIPGKSHSWVKRCNSQVSIETLDFAQLCTFYQRDRSRIAGGGAREGGAIAGWPPTLFPADAGIPSIDRHSERWRARNVTKWPGLGGYRGSTTGEE